MNKFLRRMAIAPLLVASATAQADTKNISIANFGDHPALVSIVTGFKARMEELGYVEGTDVTYEYRHVNFDRSLIPQMLQLTQGDDPDLILSITTGVTQASIRGIRDDSIPIVFAGVVDPVVAGIVPSWDAGSDRHAGASMLPDMKASLSFVQQVLPEATRIGTLYNPGEDNDITNVELIEEAGAELGLEIVTVAVDTANDLPQRVQSFEGRVDAVFLIQSNVIQTAIPVVAQISQRLHLPVINSVYNPAMKDQLVGFYAVSYEQNGVHAADIADRVLKGEDTAAIPPYVPTPDDFIAIVSTPGLNAIGREVPAALADSPWVVE